MSYRHPVLSDANLLAFLEAIALGWVDASEDERQRVYRIAERIERAESRKRRAHRRPSPGRSRPLRNLGQSKRFP